MKTRSEVFCLMGCCLGAAVVTASVNAAQFEELTEYFRQANVVAGPELVECTLSGGSRTSCFRITVTPSPATYTPGPWCPDTIADSAENGGIWLENGEVHDVSGAFIEDMANFYSDNDWQLFDEDTGAVFVTDTLEKCAGAAQPEVDPEFRQQCVECQMAYLDEDATVTYTIPLEPVAVEQPLDTRDVGSGLAFNGIRLDAPAPVADILGNYTLAPFDDCGGHVNLHVGYHYHAATDCLDDTASKTEHGSVVGVAMDGYLIHARLLNDGSLPADLDQCGGHETDELSYHYHAGEQGSNAILSCLKAEYGCVSEEPGVECDASVSRRPGGGGDGRPDFAAAAQRLGVSEDELMRALGAPPPDFDQAAGTLGVTVDALQEAMGRP
ncbi:YHYH protein [Granulosicoccus sp. 3-233]|uniref:YHYH protein n=1 Tax=Granulosicoccus sp. 3-233 TaxID=3417969 RepID=UPI003D32B0B3